MKRIVLNFLNEIIWLSIVVYKVPARRNLNNKFDYASFKMTAPSAVDDRCGQSEDSMSDPARLLRELTPILEGKAPDPDCSAEDHKGDAANEPVPKVKVGSENEAKEEEPLAFEGSADFKGTETTLCVPAEGKDATSADVIKAIDGVKQTIGIFQEAIGHDPDSATLGALQEILDAMNFLQDTMAEDARQDQEAQAALGTASQQKHQSTRERTVKADKVTRKRPGASRAKKK